MKHATTLAAASLAALSLAAHAHAQKEPTTDASRIFKKDSPSIVVVRTSRSDGSPYKQGSGVVVGKNLVATNCHVVEGSSSISVGVAEGAAAGVLTKGDAVKDICLVSVPTGSMPVAEIRPSKTMTIGETVFAIGWPKGLELTLSSGLVSQLRGGDSPVIQTTAAISPGSSGGGLFDAKGKLVGITTYKVEGGESLNFATPADWIASLPLITTQKIAEDSRATRGAAIKRLIETKQLKEAIAKSQEWADDDPDFFRPHWLMAVAFHQLRQSEAALAEYQKAIDMKPDQADSWRGKGAVLLGIQKNAAAIAALKESLRLESGNSEAWGLLSSAYQNERQGLNALAAIYRALDIKETDLDLRWATFVLSVLGMNKTAVPASQPGDFKAGHVSYAADIPLEAWRRAAALNPKNAENTSGYLGAMDSRRMCDEVQQYYGELKQIDAMGSIEYANKHSKPSIYVKCPVAP